MKECFGLQSSSAKGKRRKCSGTTGEGDIACG